MILYEKGTTDFSKNGLGYLNNVLSAYVTEELNGEYSLEFTYPLNEILSNELKEERIVKCKVSDGTNQCFIIKNVVKTYEKMTISCSHLFYLLLTNITEDSYPQNLSPKPFLDWILARANYQLPFTTSSDVSVVKSARYVRRNIVDIILGDSNNSMVNLFGIEIKRNNWNIALNTRIGADRGEQLIYGKNITGINITIDTNEMYTRIMPIGFDGLLLPEKYVDADNISDYPYPKIGIFEFSNIKYDPEDPEAYDDIEDAYDALREAVEELYANGVNMPKINIKIDWLELSKTEEYKQYSNLEKVELGDTIHAKIFGLNYTTRVIKIKYNPLIDRIEQFEIGTFAPNIVTRMNNFEIQLEKVNPTSILEEAQTNATNLITQAMGGYVYKTHDELYIMDNEDPTQAQKVWRWNINGLGYSNTGINGTYGLAMTMNGSIVADFITAGTISAITIDGNTMTGNTIIGGSVLLTSNDSDPSLKVVSNVQSNKYTDLTGRYIRLWNSTTNSAQIQLDNSTNAGIIRVTDSTGTDYSTMSPYYVDTPELRINGEDAFAITTETFTITKTSGNGNIIGTPSYVKYGNIVQIFFTFNTSGGSTGVGSNVFVGTISDISLPKISEVNGTGYYSSSGYICAIKNDGSLNIRVIGSTLASNSDPHGVSVTYICE